MWSEPPPTTVVADTPPEVTSITADTTPTITDTTTPTIDTAPTTEPIEGTGSTLASETGGTAGIYDIGPGTKMPLNAEPSSVIPSFDVNGEMRRVGLYDGQGNIVERIDVIGRPHAGVETPHVVTYDWTEYPGGLGYSPSFAGPATLEEREIIGFLLWFM